MGHARPSLKKSAERRVASRRRLGKFVINFQFSRFYYGARPALMKQSTKEHKNIISDDIKQRTIIGIGGRFYIFIIIVTGDSSVDNK